MEIKKTKKVQNVKKDTEVIPSNNDLETAKSDEETVGEETAQNNETQIADDSKLEKLDEFREDGEATDENPLKKERKSIKREYKILIGISIIVLSIAIIFTIVLLAITSGSASTVLYNKAYSIINGTVVDDTIIGVYKGDYVLVHEDGILGARYDYIELYDEEKGIYVFCDGEYWGKMDKNGKELERYRSNGIPIKKGHYKYFMYSDVLTGKHYASYYDENTDKFISMGGYDKIFQMDEIFSINGLNVSASKVEADIVIILSGGKYFIKSFNTGAQIEITATPYFTSGTVTIDFVTYNLETLTKIEELRGASPQGSFSGVKFDFSYVNQMFVKVENGILSFKKGAHATSIVTPKILQMGEDYFLISNTLNNLENFTYMEYYNGIQYIKGNGKKLEIGGKNYFYLEGYLIDGNGVILGTVTGGENIEIIGNDKILAGDNLYTLANEKLTLSLSHIRHFQYEQSEHLGGKEINYYVSDTEVYNDKLEKIVSGVGITPVDIGVFKAGNTYYNDNGKKVEGVLKAVKAQSYAFGSIPESYKYIFDIGNKFVTFDGLIFDRAKLEKEVSLFTRMGNNFFAIVKSKMVFADGESSIDIAGFKDIDIVNNNIIAVSFESAIKTYRVMGRRVINQDSYFGVSVSMEDATKYGLVYTSNGLKGIINKKGDVTLNPTYTELILAQDFALAANTTAQEFFGGIISFDGYQRTKLEYSYLILMKDGALARKSDETFVLFNENGSSLLDNIKGIEVLKNINTDKSNEVRYNYYALKMGGSYRLLKTPIIY